jgi:hypothetical protein
MPEFACTHDRVVDLRSKAKSRAEEMTVLTLTTLFPNIVSWGVNA